MVDIINIIIILIFGKIYDQKYRISIIFYLIKSVTLLFMAFCSLLSLKEDFSKNLIKQQPRAKRYKLVALMAFGKTSMEKIIRVLDLLKVNFVIILPGDTPSFKDYSPTHIILSGGPKHVYETNHYILPQWIIESQCPVLGICYGMQLIAYTFGGTVIRMPEREEGPVSITEFVNNCTSNHEGLNITSPVQVTHTRWMNRHDQVMYVPKMFDITGVTYKNHISSFTDNKKWWAVQYHPESSKHGDIHIFKRFLNLRCDPTTP